jgi:hypothetical protein
VRTLVSEDVRERLNKPEPRDSDPAHQRVNLVAAVLTAHAPFAEMLAVVPQHVIALFAEARTGTTNHLAPIVYPCLSGPNPDFPSVREATQRHLLDTTSAQAASVLQYLASTGVNAVVCVRTARGDDVRPEGRLLSRPERLIARSTTAARTVARRKSFVC